MLSARDLSVRRGPQPLFEHVNFTVYRGNKVGITGANGTGKSTLYLGDGTAVRVLDILKQRYYAAESAAIAEHTQVKANHLRSVS